MTTMTTDETLTADLILTTLATYEKAQLAQLEQFTANAHRIVLEGRVLGAGLMENITRTNASLTVYKIVSEMIRRLRMPRAHDPAGYAPDSNALVAAVHRGALARLVEEGFRSPGTADYYEAREWAHVYRLTEPEEN